MVHAIWDEYPEIKEQLYLVRELMIKELTPTHPDVQKVITEYIQASGKFIRAGICLLFAYYTGNLDDKILYRAASIEVLHLATLIHDDVIDEADTRRNLEAIHKRHSNRIAIYAGDYLLAYSGRLAKKGYTSDLTSDFGNERLIELILAGELRQLMHQYDSNLTLPKYLKQIRGKTAQLFGISAQAGIINKDTSTSELRNAYQAGLALGMAFQLADDLIDYECLIQDSGKPQYQDVQNGIYTAPILFAQQRDKRVVELLVKNEWNETTLILLHDILKNTDALLDTKQLCQRYLKKCEYRLRKLFTNDQCVSFSRLIDIVFQ